VCCSCENKGGTCESKSFLRDIVVCVAGPSDLAGSILVEILHSSEGGDVEQVCSNLKIVLLCLRLLISLTHLCLYVLHAFIVNILIYLIYLCLIVVCLGLFDILYVCIPYLFITCLILYLCLHKY